MREYGVNVISNDNEDEITGCILRDLIAISNCVAIYNRELVVHTNNKQLLAILPQMGYLTSNDNNAGVTLLYKTQEMWPEYPDNQRLTVKRDLFITKKSGTIDLDHPSNGHALKNPVRYSFSNTSRMYNHPNGYAPPDAAMVMMWGPVKA